MLVSDACAIGIITLSFAPKKIVSTEWHADEQTSYKKNAFGIEEPVQAALINPAELDAVLVPLLISDTQGFRVGYGKGYYDRFLYNCRRDVLKIGFSYFEPVDQIDDIHQFDIPLSICVTPNKIYEF